MIGNIYLEHCTWGSSETSLKHSGKELSINQRCLWRAGRQEWQLPAVYKGTKVLTPPALERVAVGSSVEFFSRNGLQLKRVVTCGHSSAVTTVALRQMALDVMWAVWGGILWFVVGSTEALLWLHCSSPHHSLHLVPILTFCAWFEEHALINLLQGNLPQTQSGKVHSIHHILPSLHKLYVSVPN